MRGEFEEEEGSPTGKSRVSDEGRSQGVEG